MLWYQNKQCKEFYYTISVVIIMQCRSGGLFCPLKKVNSSSVLGKIVQWIVSSRSSAVKVKANNWLRLHDEWFHFLPWVWIKQHKLSISNFTGKLLYAYFTTSQMSFILTWHCLKNLLEEQSFETHLCEHLFSVILGFQENNFFLKVSQAYI